LADALPQNQAEQWKQQLQGDIKFEKLMIAAYEEFYAALRLMVTAIDSYTVFTISCAQDNYPRC